MKLICLMFKVLWKAWEYFVLLCCILLIPALMEMPHYIFSGQAKEDFIRLWHYEEHRREYELFKKQMDGIKGARHGGPADGR